MFLFGGRELPYPGQSKVTMVNVFKSKPEYCSWKSVVHVPIAPGMKRTTFGPVPRVSQ